MDKLKTFRVGEPFKGPSASRENEISSALRFVRQIKAGGGTGGSIEPVTLAAVVVTIKNTTGADIDRFGVLGISNALFTPSDNGDLFKSRVALQGTTPSSTDHVGKFVVLKQPIKAGKLGKAYIDGIFPCKVDITDADHGYADLKNSSTASLESRAYGPARIIYKESGTGVKHAYVSLSLAAAGPLHFAVKVAKVSGSDGTASTAASWVYDVKDMAGNVIATSVSLTRSRPNGKATYGAGYGIAFYDGATLKLWDAGEIYGTGSC